MAVLYALQDATASVGHDSFINNDNEKKQQLTSTRLSHPFETLEKNPPQRLLSSTLKEPSEKPGNLKSS
ncbi:hypothetical protein N9B73_02285 [Verrucomicrobiales bacterium]|jgi:hypothetical protein|nr:hypothetical protein [Verrucomicrobiales bacterium]